MPAAAPNRCPGQSRFLLEPGCAALDRSPLVHSSAGLREDTMSWGTAGAAAADLPAVEGQRGASGRRASAGACAGPRAEACAQPGRLHCARADPRGARFRRARRGKRRVAAPLLEAPRRPRDPWGKRAPAPCLCAPRPQPALRRDPEQAGGGTLGAAGPGGREAGPQGGWRCGPHRGARRPPRTCPGGRGKGCLWRSLSG